MLWLIFALLSAFFAALVAIFGKIGVRGVDPTVATAIRAVVMTVFALVIVFASRKSLLNIDRKSVLYVALSGVAGVLSWIFYFAALKYGKVSQIVPVDRASLLIAIALAAIFLGEKISLKTAIGALLVFLGILIISLR